MQFVFFYSALTISTDNNKVPDMLSWERELTKTFTVEQWSKAIHLRVTACIDHWDVLFFK